MPKDLRGRRHPGWELLGRAKVSFHVDHDAIEIAHSEDWYRDRLYRRLRFVVEGGDVRFRRIKLIYINGYAEVVPIDREIDAGQEFDIGLPGDRSYLRRIEMVYSSRLGLTFGPGGLRFDQGAISVYGERTRRRRQEPASYRLPSRGGAEVCLRAGDPDRGSLGPHDWACARPGEPAVSLSLDDDTTRRRPQLQIRSRTAEVCLQHSYRSGGGRLRSGWHCTGADAPSDWVALGRNGRRWRNQRIRFKSSLRRHRVCLRYQQTGHRGRFATDWLCSRDSQPSPWLWLGDTLGDDRHRLLLRLE